MIDSPSQPLPAVPPPPEAGSQAAGLQALGSLSPAPGAYHFRLVVPQTIGPNDFPRLASLVRTLAPDVGSAQQLGDGLQWEYDSGYSALSLTVNPEPAGAVIRADLRTDGQKVAYGLGAIGAGLISSFVATALHAPLEATFGVGLATLGLTGWAARHLWHHTSRHKARRVEQLVAAIAAALRGELD